MYPSLVNKALLLSLCSVLADFWAFMHMLSNKIRSDNFWRWLFWTKGKTEVVSLFFFFLMESSPLFIVNSVLLTIINQFLQQTSWWGLNVQGSDASCLACSWSVCVWRNTFACYAHFIFSYTHMHHTCPWVMLALRRIWKHWQHYCAVQFSQNRYKQNCWIVRYKQV